MSQLNFVIPKELVVLNFSVTGTLIKSQSLDSKNLENQLQKNTTTACMN